MPSLRYLIDSMCANLTVEFVHELVRAQLTAGPSSISDIAHAIMEKDPSLDTGAARTLAQAAVEALAQGDGAATRGDDPAG